MRKILGAVFISIIVIILNTVPSTAAPINGLYNTGVDSSGNVLSAGSIDPHYLASGLADTAYTLSPGDWVKPPSTAAWVGPINGNQWGPASGVYSYMLSFDLTGFDPAKTMISGSWSSDDIGEIFLNGIYTGIKNDLFGYTSLKTFQVENGFKSGENLLEFRVTNIMGPTGLVVSDLEGETSPISPVSSVPIPGALWLLGSGFIGLAGMRSHLNK